MPIVGITPRDQGDDQLIGIDMSEQVVAITGAAGGIGAGIAGRFAAAGATLVLQHHTSAPPSVDGPHTSVQLDLVDPDAPGMLVDAAVERFGRLDAVVNNAAIQYHASFVDMTDAEWSEMMETNVTACHRITQAFARHVVERDGTEGGGDGGSVVHISSIEGTQPAIGHGHYGISKAALLMHTKVAAIELGSLGIRVNSVSPGLIDRDGLAEAWPDGVSRWHERAPLGRLGRASDIGDACVFLCSPLARWVSGTNLIVDGGMSARSTW